jgi:hypothetical protein
VISVKFSDKFPATSNILMWLLLTPVYPNCRIEITKLPYIRMAIPKVVFSYIRSKFDGIRTKYTSPLKCNHVYNY